MTKKEFMYITGYEDEQQVDNIMLLCGDQEPEDGDWTELARKWYEDMRQEALRCETKYLELLKKVTE